MFNTGELDRRWAPFRRNPLLEARDRRGQFAKPIGMLGDVNITKGTAIAPVIRTMVNPMQSPMIPNMVRQMGENTLQTRRRGRPNLWAATPVESNLGRKTLADIDLTEELSDWDTVGWEWNRVTNKLIAYLTKGEKTYKVKIPIQRLCRIFSRCLAANGGEREYFRETTIDGLFKKLGRGLKKAVKGAFNRAKEGITAPIRFVKNPKKFIKDTGKSIKKLVKGVGKTALKVVSSPVFAGVMTAVAAIPPLTAVGGVGLAAYAAANALKPAFKAAETAVDTVDAIAKKKKAGDIIRSATSGINNMPKPAGNLMKAALKSVPDKQLSKAGRELRRKKSIFRLKNGFLKQL